VKQPNVVRSMAVSAITVTALSGCSLENGLERNGTTPVSLYDAVGHLEYDLTRVHTVILSDAEGLTPDGKSDTEAATRIRVGIAKVQCYDYDPKTDKNNPMLRKQNPLIPIITGPLQVQVQGQLAVGGSFVVGAIPSIGGTVTRQGQQQIMLPLTLVSLGNLSKFYLSQQMSNLQYTTLVSESNQKVQVASYIANIMNVAAKLDLLQKEALRDFSAKPGYCDGNEGGRS
jgi:hypothetical protein